VTSAHGVLVGCTGEMALQTDETIGLNPRFLRQFTTVAWPIEFSLSWPSLGSRLGEILDAHGHIVAIAISRELKLDGRFSE
jgi:hypothetical protein